MQEEEIRHVVGNAVRFSIENNLDVNKFVSLVEHELRDKSLVKLRYEEGVLKILLPAKIHNVKIQYTIG